MTAKTYLEISLAIFLFLAVIPFNAHARTIYVDDDAAGANDGSSWADAYNYLQDALAAAWSGDELRVAQGIYKPDQGAGISPGYQWAKFEIVNGIAIRGGFAGYGTPEPNERDVKIYETILSGDLAGNDVNVDHPKDLYDHPSRDDNSYHILRADKVGPDTILDGLTISGGNSNRSYSGGMLNYQGSPTLINCTFKRNVGYGMYNDADCNSTLINCSFIENTSTVKYPYYGCALSVNYLNNCVIKNCIFAKNYRGAIRNWGRAILTNCTFSGNYGYGISNEDEYSDGTSLTNCTFNGNERGILNSFSSPVIKNCIFMSNSTTSGGGMFNGTDSSPLVIDCLFSGNSAVHGGGMYNTASKPTIINCAFVGNSASGGGAIYNDNDADANLINCSFTGNSSYMGGAVCNDDGSNATLTNCILWGNTADKGPEIALLQYYYYYPPYTTPSITINNCDVQGAKAAIFMETDAILNWGPGNISVAPFFIDADGADNIFGTEDDNPRLLPSSPCIDKGDNSGIPPSVLTDLDGDERIVNGIVDMGPYEGPDQGIVLSKKAVAVPEGATITFTVALALDPLETVEVNVSYHSGDSDITVESGQVLIFDSSNYSIPQTVTLAAAEDEDRLNSKSLIYVTAAGLIGTSVAATEADNEPYPNILLVDDDAPGENNGSNWEDAFTNLHQATIAAAAIAEIEEIWVAQGTYKPDRHSGITPGDRSAAFNLVNAVVIKGGFAGYGAPAPDARDINSYETILSGDLAGDDVDLNDPIELIDHPARVENSYHVVYAQGADHTAVLDGFTVTGGNANYDNYDSGGGIYEGSPTIKNCRIIGNSAQWSGGGVELSGWSSYRGGILQSCTISGNAAGWSSGAVWGCERITNCVISDNVAVSEGGAIYIGDVVVSDCVFSGNRALYSGGAIYSWNQRPVFIRCSFINNSSEEGAHTGYYSGTGGALSFDGCGTCSDSLPQFHHCKFIGNSAARIGGAIYSVSNTYVQLNGCLFAGNTAGAAGPALFDSSYFGTSAINCTMADNKIITSGAGAGGYIESYPTYGGISDMTGCIVWNTDLGIAAYDIDLNYCCIKDGTQVGTGNIGADPCFVLPGYRDANGLWIHGDYNLLSDSPCIDAGDPNYVAEPNETDLDGKQRLIAGRIDMGAYEYGVLIAAEVKIVPNAINLQSKGKWITALLSLSEEYDVADIDPDSILLKGEIEATSLHVDEEKQVATARFSREEVRKILDTGDIELTISGRLADGALFEARDIVKVIDKAGKNNVEIMKKSKFP